MALSSEKHFEGKKEDFARDILEIRLKVFKKGYDRQNQEVKSMTGARINDKSRYHN